MMGLTSTLPTPPVGLDLLKGLAQEGATASSKNTRQESERALATVKEVASQSRQNTAVKDAAMQKLHLLKTQLDHLAMFGGDPATRARQAAQIGKQIGDAAQDYARAGGSSADAAAEQPSSAAMADATTPASSTDAGKTASASAPPALEWLTGTVLPAVNGTAGKVAASGSRTASSSKTTDQVFMAEARLLAREANAIIKSALDEQRQPKATDETRSAADKALSAIDNATFVLGSGRGQPIASTLGYGATARSVAATTPPTVAVIA